MHRKITQCHAELLSRNVWSMFLSLTVAPLKPSTMPNKWAVSGDDSPVIPLSKHLEKCKKS